MILLCFACNREIRKQGLADTECGLDVDECSLCKNENAELFIAVVGDGVEDTTPVKRRASSITSAQGQAMWTGAHVAFDTLDEDSQLKPLVRLRSFDDGGSKTCARRIAQCLYQNSCLIGVIGHANSGTTRAAAPVYNSAQIPVLMPIATSPYVFFENSSVDGISPYGSSFDNMFQLPPGDGVQTLVLALFADRLLKKQKTATETASGLQSKAGKPSEIYHQGIYLLGDDTIRAANPSEGFDQVVAFEYAKPIFDGLNNEILGPKKFMSKTLSQMSSTAIADDIFNSNVTVVLFAGYWSNFEPVLRSLSVSFNNSAKVRPKILLSDGGFDQTLITMGFDVYVTFPLPSDYSISDDVLKDETISAKHNNIDTSLAGSSAHSTNTLTMTQLGTHPTYELFAYDALRLYGKAIHKLQADNKPVSRMNILNYFRSGKMPGRFFNYLFKDGENTASTYYVLDIKNKKAEMISEEVLSKFKRDSLEKR